MFKSIEDYFTLVGVTLTKTFGTKNIITIAACKSKLFVEIFSKIRFAKSILFIVLILPKNIFLCKGII